MRDGARGLIQIKAAPPALQEALPPGAAALHDDLPLCGGVALPSGLAWGRLSGRAKFERAGLVAGVGLVVFLGFADIRRDYWQPLVGLEFGCSGGQLGPRRAGSQASHH